MVILVIGIVVFFGIHLLPGFVSTRQALIERFGDRTYRGAFALLSFVGLALIIWGKAVSDAVFMYVSPFWTYKIMPLLMVPAFILMAAAGMKSNIKRFTRHPQLWGVTLWSGGHLLVNGDLSSLLLFGSFLLFSLYDMWSANRRGALQQTEKLPLIKDIQVLVAGTVVAVIVAFVHPWLFGVRAIV
ncbi:NnrU family protein [Gynuella sp.]|uniref:NnrU family protein n=1 Tax=Gynuella sp. TaxID=2969146 RepID=UPI003D10F9C7